MTVHSKGMVLEVVASSQTDWYPTLLSAAGIEAVYPRSRRLEGSDSLDLRFEGDWMVPLDGLDLWTAINDGVVSADLRSEYRSILLDLDGTTECEYTSCGAQRAGNWKFVRGSGSRFVNFAKFLFLYFFKNSYFAISSCHLCYCAS